MTETPWTEQAVTLLTALWQEGHSCSVIARRLAGATGAIFTRNSVIGKRLRLGLPDRRTGKSRPAFVSKAMREKIMAGQTFGRGGRTKPAAGALSAPPAIVSPRIDPLAALNGGLALLDLTPTTCRWPYTSNAETVFCGRLCGADNPYCDHHARRSIVAISPRIQNRAHRGAPRAARF